MKSMKRMAALLLVLTLLLSLAPSPVMARATELEAPVTEPSSAATDPTVGEPLETTAPTEAPPEETTGPVETVPPETTAPTEETTAPTQESTVPTEETTVPTVPETEPEESSTPTEETTEPTEAPTEPVKTTNTLAGYLEVRDVSVSVTLLDGHVVAVGTHLAVTPSGVDDAGADAAMAAVGMESIADSCIFRLDIPDEGAIGAPLQVKLFFNDSTFNALGNTSVYVVELMADGTAHRLEAAPFVNEKLLQEITFQVGSYSKDSQFLVLSSDFPTSLKIHSIVGNWAVQGFSNVSCGQATRLHDITYHYVEGKDTPGYCLEPHKTFGYATSGGASSEHVGVGWGSGGHGSDVWENFSERRQKAIALIAMLGINQNTFDWDYDSTSGTNVLNPTNPNQCDFAAAQIMIWEVVAGYRVFPDPSYSSSDKLIDNWDRGNVRDSYDALEAKIEDWVNTTDGERLSVEDSEFRVSWVTSSDQVVLTVADFAYETVTPPTPPTGDLKVTKNVSGSGTRQNWRFELYSSRSNAEAGTGLIQSAYTNSSGVATFSNIKNGTYYVREAPASRQDRVDTTGWTMSNTVLSGTVNGNTISVGSVTNTAPAGDITVQKGLTSASTSGKLNGWVFQVSTNNSFSNIVATLTTDSSGKASTGKKLSPGIYYVREAPLSSQNRSDKGNYILDNNIVTVRINGSETVFANNGSGVTASNVEMGEIVVQKAVNTTAGTSGKLNGWLFQISTDTNFANVVKTLSTDASGKANTGKTLAPGTYYVREAPYALQTRPDKDQFTLDESVQKVIVPAGGSVQAFAHGNATATNHEKGRIRVAKGVEGIAADATSLSGWVFLVLNDRGEEVAAVTTGTDGYGTTGYLVPGNYTVQEAPRERQTRQDISSWELSEESVKVTVTAGKVVDAFNPGGHTAVNYHGKFLKIQKVPNCPDTVIDQLKDNAMYTLAGAKYDIIVGGKVIETLVTDADGRATSKTLFQNGDAGTLVETEAPSGYLLDETSVPFTIPAGTEDYVVEVSDVPTFDPTRFNLSKVDAVTGEPMGDASFAGAIFRWDYFDNLDCSGTPVRTWYFTTGEDGKYSYAPQYLADSSQHISDDLFYDGTDYILPVGSVIVSEVFAPSGYTNIPQLQATITQPSSGSYAKWEWSEESVKYLTEVSDGFEIPEPQDTTSFGALSIQKIDKDLGTNIPDSINFAGCEFSVYNRSAKAVKVGDYAVAQPGEVCYVLTTDESGVASTDAIFPVGTYEVKETKGNDFFEINEQWSYTFSVADGKTQFATECANTMISIVIHVQKVNEAGELLPGARFVLEWSENGKIWTPVFAAQELSKGGCSSENLAADGSLITDETGYATFEGLYPLGFYRITEVATPNGYSLLTEPILVESPTHEQNYEVTYKVVDGYVFNLPKTGVADMPLLSLGLALSLLIGSVALIYWKKKEC